MRAYIAAPFFNKEQLDLVKQTEHILSMLEIDYFSPRSEGVIKEMSPIEKEKYAKRMYDKNIRELTVCDIHIFHVDHPDTGTAFELGYSAGLIEIMNKHLITISTFGKPVNLMLKYCLDAHCLSHSELQEILIEILEGRGDSLPSLTLEIDE